TKTTLRAPWRRPGLKMVIGHGEAIPGVPGVPGALGLRQVNLGLPEAPGAKAGAAGSAGDRSETLSGDRSPLERPLEPARQTTLWQGNISRSKFLLLSSAPQSQLRALGGRAPSRGDLTVAGEQPA
ncbi:unnamed protein product, partial [Polarella glacialis]